MAKNIAVLTSGGDAPGMNAAVRAVVRKGIYHHLNVYGFERGYDGVINDKIMPLNLNSVAGIIQHGGTMLKTARSEAFKTPEGFERALNTIKKYAIDALVVIGGDGSMAGAKKLSEYGVKTMVIPATIDNDMCGTEYSIGFDTALNNVLDAVNKIRDTAESHERVAVIEVMGRSSGHIALMAGFACGAESILLPEKSYDMDALCEGLKQSYGRGKLYSIVMVAEGAGKGFKIAEEIAKRTTFQPHVTVLGYIQRGGSPSAFDNIMGSKMGALAVDCILKGKTNRLVAVENGLLLTKTYEDAFSEQRGVDLSLYELAEILAM